MKPRKKFLFAFLVCVILSLAIPVVNKALPITREQECYRSFFPKESFQKRLSKPAACWMIEQIEKDFAPFPIITTEALSKTYDRICEKLGPGFDYYHFRILNNKLYKYVPDGFAFSDTDTLIEKALKTLLLYANLPDCDFVLCGIDGIPEPYLPADFYLVEDQAPVLTWGRREGCAPYTVLIPDQLSLSKMWYSIQQEILQNNEMIGWEQKAPIAIWRGGMSDTGEPTDGRFAASYDKTPRYALCKISSEHPELVDAGLTNLDSREMERVAKKEGIFKAPLSKKEHLLGKYLPVLDGHMCSYPGYQWRLLSNSVCFKQESDQVQWFYKALRPYVHYIPVQNNLSDLKEKIKWAKEHDSEAACISNNARAFAKENLLYSEVYFYFYKVLCELASREKIDFTKLKKETDQDPHWKCIQYRKRLALQKSITKFLNSCRHARFLVYYLY